MRSIAIINQKGGVGKTTTTVNLGAALARAGQRVGIIDVDPQAHASLHLGIDPQSKAPTVYDLLTEETSISDLWQRAGASSPPCAGEENLLVAASHIDLAAVEVELAGVVGREVILRDKLAAAADLFDYILIDCPPSLGVLTINGLTVAEQVLVPLQCEALSHRGVAQLLETIDDVRLFANPALAVRGIIATMYDARTRHSRAILDDVRSRYGLPVLDPPIAKSVRFAEAPAQGRSILRHAPGSPGAEAYRTIARTLHADATR
jgi:chromosome partitioning protein